MPAKKKHLIKSISMSKIKRYKNNPRTHDEKQIEILVQNIKTNGYINPIIVDKKMVIIAGHGRHQALEKIYGKKDPKINIVIADLTPKEARKQRIADNKIGELSEWDMELLQAEIMDMVNKIEGMDSVLDELALTEDNIFPDDFNPGTLDDQGQLDRLDPKMVKCPKCGKVHDARKTEVKT